MASDLQDVIETLRGQGYRVECRPELGGRLAAEGVRGPCVFEGTLGFIPVRGVFVKARSASRDVVRELVRLKADTGSALAVLVVEEEAPEPVAALASLLGVILVSGVPEAPPEAPREEAAEYTVPPVIDYNAAVKIMSTKIRNSIQGMLGSVFSQKKASFVGMRMAYLSLRCYDIVLHSLEESPEALETRKTVLCFETATGSLVGFDEEGLVIYEELMRLGELDDDAVRVLELLSKIRSASLNEIVEFVGSSEKARVIVNILEEFGLLEPDLEGFYRIAPLPVSEYTSPYRLLSDKGIIVRGRPPECMEVLGPGFDISKLDRIVSAFGLVESVSTLYYPVYIGVFRKRKDGKHVDVATILDAVTGRRLEDLEELIADSNVIYQLDRIIDDIVSGSAKQCPEEEGLGTGSTASQPASGSTGG